MSHLGSSVQPQSPGQRTPPQCTVTKNPSKIGVTNPDSPKVDCLQFHRVVLTFRHLLDTAETLQPGYQLVTTIGKWTLLHILPYELTVDLTQNYTGLGTDTKGRFCCATEEEPHRAYDLVSSSTC
jgi:hypothetical protein